MNITMLLASLTVLPAELFNANSLAFLSGYLKNQKNLIIFNLNGQADHRLDKVQKVFVGNLIIGIEVWKITNDESKLEFHDMGEGIGSPSTIKSYVVFVDLVETFLGFLPKFTKINSNGKWIFIFDNQTLDEVELVFKQAWKRHKMLNILGVIFMDEIVQFCLYNPFKFNSKGVRGIFYYFKSDEWSKAQEIHKTRLSNLHEYPIKILDEKSFMCPILNHNKQLLRYQYIDGTILLRFQQMMNFKFVFLLENYTRTDVHIANITEDLFAIENNIVDFPSKSSLITRLNTTNVAFLQTMDITTVCYVVPKQEPPINYLITQFEILSLTAKIAFTITIACLMIVWSLIEFIRSKKGQKHDSINDLLLIMGQVHASSSIHNLSKYNNRGMLIFVLMFFFILCNTYQGIIASRLVHQPLAKEVDTLEGVDRLGCNVLSTAVGDVFAPTVNDIETNSIYYRLSQKPTKFLDIQSFFYAFDKPLAECILTGTVNAKFIIPTFYDLKNGRDVLHLVKERLSELHRSFMIPKNSPYRERVNELLDRLIEFGFLEVEKLDHIRAILMLYIARSKMGFGEEPRLVVIKMEHVNRLKILWIICLSIATIVFFIEIFVHYIVMKLFQREVVSSTSA